MRIELLSIALCLSFIGSSGFAQPVGTAAAVNQSAHGAPPQQPVRTITIGDNIIHDERIETNSNGLLQILLADGTTFTVGPGSQLTIDSFVYDPDAGAAKVTASLGKGLFRFVGGKTSKTPDGVILNTPVGTVGIRGAIADIAFDPGHGMPSHIDLLYGDRITLMPPGGAPARLYKAGYSIVIDGSNQIRVRKTPQQWTQAFQLSISGRNGSGGGAKVKPTGSMVAASGIPGTNSEYPLPLNSPQLPALNPIDQDPQVVDQGKSDVVRQRIEQSLEYAE